MRNEDDMVSSQVFSLPQIRRNRRGQCRSISNMKTMQKNKEYITTAQKHMVLFRCNKVRKGPGASRSGM